MLKASGLGVFSFSGLNKDRQYKSIDRRTRIVAGRSQGEVIYTKKVPQKWIDHQKSIRKLTEKLRKKWKEKSFVGSVSYVPTTRMEGGVYFSVPEISVRPNATDEQISHLPTTFNDAGINKPNATVVSDIKIRKMNGEFHNMDGVNCDRYEANTGYPFPGGLEIRDVNSNKIGTSGCRVSDINGNNYLYTANHVIRNSCRIGTSAVNDGQGNRLGSGEDGHKTHDWLMVNDNSLLYADWIDIQGGLQTVHGYATQNGMESIQGQPGKCQIKESFLEHKMLT